MNSLSQINAPFNGTELVIVDYNNQPYTPMRPIVEGIGLDWKAQLVKIKQRFNSVVAEITTTGKDGKNYQMLCLPLRKLFGWLMTISPNKVKPELRETVIMYQNECDDVLWDYWTKGQAINNRLTITPEQQHALHEIVDRRAGKNRSQRASMWVRHNRHFGIAKYSQLLSVHFDEAKQYLEAINVVEKSESDPLERLENLLDRVSARYPALENPLAYEIAQQVAEKLKYQSSTRQKNFWISVQENGAVAVHQYTSHHTPVNVVQLREKFNQLWDFLHKDEVLELGKVLKRFPYEPIRG
ncbi:phage antirepressor N-terminal domain-containing protein [Acinetobacter baumannii]|uniref:phage antirepressor N-terminal domain-containing protein n=1 Tax=Acinetobacter nosocomialis TaxID=106654 RepID=UPI001A9B5610|nr:phage antirepressor N-terminal domain-containing protein [Acinetobacter nosocomialis]MDC5109073.1 hypothetical protein [Acinetobacter baumannii]MBO1280758.1 hypothetical protein [Acinetobacter nosocomialis]HCV3095699.1 hypothetical protein [Acinetobacter baumannii]HCV3155764.1 hypothetical protein [Acinetobacter baumannii]HCV3310010.1 hypothetical protein [Acinetobacter baumannii]